MKKLKVQLQEHIVDLAALFVSILALVVSCSQQKDIQIAEYRPLLVIEFLKKDSEPHKGIVLKNVGLGPALIQSFRYYKDESAWKAHKPDTSWIPTYESSLAPYTFQDLTVLEPNYVIGENQSLFLLGTDGQLLQPASDSASTHNTSFFNSVTAHHLESLIIEIEYKSIYAPDTQQYYLRFCERFVANNIFDPDMENSYESASIR
ncbi:hypothetical protein QNI16_09115 [Cytophagaceae bacterium YF14B1]|uniref:Uncharacterized protein n=1 Tax=Xanthocytophaga flava TaxID=3048013 RepID=A0AAE3QNL4_9BACT|nr:hypothetical protein [Xanthocytophaga flavus]MDJ1480643.1 hypothetical protein [Xanthocytophaga flavus]